MDEPDPVVAALTDVRDEIRRLRALHAAPKPWHGREPFRTMLTHAVTVAVALSLGYAVHALTGAPMPAIEAKSDKTEPSVTAAAPEPEATTEVTPPSYALIEPPPSPTPSASTVKPRKAIVPQIRSVVAMASASRPTPPPAAPATGVPVPIPAPQEPAQTASPRREP